jgi:hypothetical protein
MGLRDELQALDTKHGLCSVGKLIEKQDPDTAQELIEILGDPSVPLQSLAKLSTAKGWRVTRDTFQKHRQKECRCVSKG